MADDDKTDPVAKLRDLHSAFDSIDDTMKDVARKEVTITPETLTRIVNDAVAQAIAAYEQARGLTPDSTRDSATDSVVANPTDATGLPAKPPAVPLSPWRANLERLQGDMGINDIEFDDPLPEPEARPSQTALSQEMGVNDFAFDDAPAPAVEPAAPAADDIDAGFELATPEGAGRADAPQDEYSSTLAVRQETEEVDDGVEWLEAELKAVRTTVERDYVPASARSDAALPPAPADAAEPVVNRVDEPAVPVLVKESPMAPQPEVPVTQKAEVQAPRTSLVGWFRSALVARAAKPVPEPVAADDAPEPPAQAVPAPVPVPAPPPARPTPAAAANTIFFTFDPIPPVPPRLPREPKEQSKA